MYGILNGRKTFTGDILLNDISIKSNISQYRKNIDSISDDEIISDLSVEEYLNFYAMLRGIFGSELSVRKKEIFLKYKYIVSSDIKMNQLFPDQRIYVRILASLLKNPKFLILQNIFLHLEGQILQELVSVINDYIYHNGICLILSQMPDSHFEHKDCFYLK